MKPLDFHLVPCAAFDSLRVAMKEMSLVLLNSGILWGLFKFYLCWEKNTILKLKEGTDMVYDNKFFYYIYFHTQKSLNRFFDKKVCFFLIPVCWFYQKMNKNLLENTEHQTFVIFFYWFWSSGGVYHKYFQRLMIQSSAHTLLTPQNTELIKPHPIVHF